VTAADSTVTTLISSDSNGPQWVVVDGAGNLYITDTGKQRDQEMDLQPTTR